ncbi:hypothetical protein Q2K19_25800 [Micromonospora soli]|uniref:hypothetical protein n=1 Tax=Micromonospora sp. NBRC 110009 TaxID=3061627 RepID=UPI002673D2F3|nr:hypothetical protein [Micromonospora sp. NBRC 110009]WKT97562.1 hypothetical protein Q2K19_25800 [Micromonospora sp. NBRC 110009]
MATNEWVAVNELWAELQKVQAVGAWRSTAALCGQILEVTLRLTLSAKLGMQYKRIEKMKFQDVINLSIKKDLFASEAKLTIIGSLHNARVRRNIASHFSPYNRHGPNERRATNSIALLICFVDWLLLGDDRTHMPTSGELTTGIRARHLIAETCAGKPLPEGATWSNTFAVALADVTPRNFVKLSRHVRELDTVVQRQFTSQVHENLPLLVRRCGPSHINDVLELIDRLWALGMKEHARLFASMVPIDSFTVEAVSGPGRSLQTARKLLAASSKADPLMFRELISNTATAHALVTALRKRVRTSSFNSREVSLMLHLLPPRVQAMLWCHEFHKYLLAALSTKPPVAYVHMLSTLQWHLIRQVPEARSAHRALSEALAVRCNSGDLAQFRALFPAVAVATSVGSPLCDAVGNTLLTRMSNETEAADNPGQCELMADLLWEIANYVPGQGDRVQDCAATLAHGDKVAATAQILAWSTSAILGYTTGLAWSASHDDAVAVGVHREPSVWKRLRIGYAAHRHGRLGPSEAAVLRETIPDPGPELLPSVALVKYMRESLRTAT